MFFSFISYLERWRDRDIFGGSKLHPLIRLPINTAFCHDCRLLCDFYGCSNCSIVMLRGRRRAMQWLSWPLCPYSFRARGRFSDRSSCARDEAAANPVVIGRLKKIPCAYWREAHNFNRFPTHCQPRGDESSISATLLVHLLITSSQ